MWYRTSYVHTSRKWKKWGLDVSQKALLLWDVFKADATDLVNAKLDRGPEHWTCHGTKEHDAFIVALRLNYEWCNEKDVKDITITDNESKLSILKTKHEKVMCQIYEYPKS